MSGLQNEPIEERFFRKVDADGICWVWLASLDDHGYGRFCRGARGLGESKAHRWSYEFLVGPIPEGMTVDHLCRNRKCVNPDHMEIVTQGTNVLRGYTLAGMNARKTHCKNGHEFTPENTRIRRHGWRECRQCIKAVNARRYKRFAEALRIVDGLEAAA